MKSSLSEEFEVEKGVRQGDLWVSLLFYTMKDKIKHETDIDRFNISGKTLKANIADDILIPTGREC